MNLHALRFALMLLVSLSSGLLVAQDEQPTSTPKPQVQKQTQVVNSNAGSSDFFKLEFGISAMYLGQDQGATRSMFLAHGDTAYVTGSSFFGAQTGISLRTNFELGQRKKIILPVGLDYTFFSGTQRLPSASATQHGYVSLNLLTVVAGAQYRLLDLPLANAFLYAGVEARGSIVPGAHFRYEVIDSASAGSVRVEMDTTVKPTVFRFGGAARFGVQGELSDPLWVNISVAYGVNNLVGRDLQATGSSRRGQLLTPARIGETNEAYSKFLQFSIWLQYRL